MDAALSGLCDFLERGSRDDFVHRTNDVCLWEVAKALLLHITHTQFSTGMPKTKCLSKKLVGILWTVANQAPLSMEFSRQECWSGLPFPPPGDLPKPGTEPMSVTYLALTGVFFTTGLPGKPIKIWARYFHVFVFAVLFLFLHVLYHLLRTC